MICYILTTDGGDREDGNVYYSKVLIVHADEATEGEAVRAALMPVFRGNDKYGRSGDITYDRYVEPETEDEEEYYVAPSNEEILAALEAAGFKAEFPTTNYIIGG